MSKLVSVFGKTADGEMELLHRGIPEDEAKKLADDYWHKTGRTAAIVMCDEKKPQRAGKSLEKFEDYLTERMDELDNAVYALLRTFQMLPEDDEETFPWDQEIIGAVSESIEELLSERGLTFCRPYYDGNDEPCHMSGECEHKSCPFCQEE